jgi:hypothetical protein
MICSIDRPVTVAVLMELGQQRGWPNNDLSYWIGRRPKDCANYVQDDRTHPGALVDHDVALVVRWLDRFPSTMMPQTAVTPRDLLVRLRRHLPGKKISGDWFATALGRHPSIGSRWCRTNALPHPTVRRAIALIDDPDPEVLCANWNTWCEHAVLEAELRGTPDLRASLQWNACRFPGAEQVGEAA